LQPTQSVLRTIGIVLVFSDSEMATDRIC
jgi:hypothetical protein